MGNQAAVKAEMGSVVFLAVLLLVGTAGYGTVPIVGQPDAKQTFRTQLEKPGQKVNFLFAYFLQLIPFFK